MCMITFPPSTEMRAIEIANTKRTSMLSHNFDLMPSHKSSVLFYFFLTAPSGAVVRLFSANEKEKKKIH